jgi:transcriptional antiterminator RfaH
MILAAECDLFPEAMFDAREEISERRWWLVHTKPRQEKALARYLRHAELPFYLPCKVYRRKAKNRVLQSYLPMFPGYAFVRVTEEERTRVYAGNHVVKLGAVRDQDRLWTDLGQVRKLLDLGVAVTTEDKLMPGTRVTIRNGPLIGMTGTILKESTCNRFVVEVDLIQRGIGVVVDLESLGKMEA